MVRIETDGARAVLNALESGAPADADRALDALDIQPDFYTTHVEDVTEETFRRLLVAPEDVPDGFAVDALTDGFDTAKNRLTELRSRIEALESVESGPIERDVRRYLPNDPNLDATVYAVIDGFNSGYQHEGDIAISILQTRPEEFGPKLRHELHHVGAREVRGDDPFGRLSMPVSPEQDVADVISVLLLEGLAIAYAQGGLSYYESDPPASDAIAEFRERERALFTELEETLDAIATTDDPDARQSLVESVVTDPDGVLPPTHYLGVRIVEEIGDVFGQSRAADLVTATEEVLPTYQTAASHGDAFRFTPKTVDRISAAVAAV
jgi:hypothetical protein